MSYDRALADVSRLQRTAIQEGLFSLEQEGTQFISALTGNPVAGVRTDHGPALASVPTARRTDPWTSHAAAKAVEPRVGTQRRAVLDALRASDGLTHEELVQVVQTIRPGTSESGIRTRTKELVDAGYVCNSGRTRKTSRGLASIVWCAS